MIIKQEDRMSSLRHCTESQKIRKCPPFHDQITSGAQNSKCSYIDLQWQLYYSQVPLRIHHTYHWWETCPYIYCRWEAHYFQLLLYRLREPHVARWCRAAEVVCRRCLHHTESHPDWADRVITDVGRVQVHRKEVEREIEREVRKISNIFYICLFIHTTRE